jgi:hypothetical protein
MSIHYVKSVDMLEIDISTANEYMPLNHVYLGVTTEPSMPDFISCNSDASDTEHLDIYMSACKFYFEAIGQI